jgi:hypothetical protein
MKFLLIAIFVALSSAPAQAGLGVVASATNHSLGNVDISGVGIAGGLVSEFGIADTFIIHSELRFVSHSVSADPYSLLVLPVLAQINIPFAGVHLQTGPSLGLKLEGEGFKSTDFAWSFGAGFGFDLVPTTKLFLDLRYSTGLTNIVDAPGADVKSKAWELLLGVIFDLL